MEQVDEIGWNLLEYCNIRQNLRDCGINSHVDAVDLRLGQSERVEPDVNSDLSFEL